LESELDYDLETAHYSPKEISQEKPDELMSPLNLFRDSCADNFSKSTSDYGAISVQFGKDLPDNTNSTEDYLNSIFRPVSGPFSDQFADDVSPHNFEHDDVTGYMASHGGLIRMDSADHATVVSRKERGGYSTDESLDVIPKCADCTHAAKKGKVSRAKKESTGCCEKTKAV